MADLVGVFAASHGPLIGRDWQSLPEPLRARFTRDFGELGRRLTDSRADTVIEISPDHWVNFFIDNLPSVCIGVGEEHEGPPEPFLKDFARTLAGDAALGRHILATALAEDFEPSSSHRLTLDHGFCIPLLRMNLAPLPRIVPLILNDLEPPMPSIRRCLAWGRLLAKAIASFPETRRVAILATGGLSHSIGERTMGEVDEAFDRGCIAALNSGDDAGIVDFLEPALRTTGNGGHEVRNWVVAHAAAGSRGFELIDYFPSPEVYVGCGFASWKLSD
ncbi:MAG: 2,3-dihydroxyphenylpropionate 1,2-dioxygenase [Rhodospirillales bacterium]|nr:2,3-dihydroxyphenylpropionate 1,2-dioxygenase [Rhodospirillales bacterium]